MLSNLSSAISSRSKGLTNKITKHGCILKVFLAVAEQIPQVLETTKHWSIERNDIILDGNVICKIWSVLLMYVCMIIVMKSI